jgi:hypothetical protein
MLRKLEHMTGIFVRRSAECFAVMIQSRRCCSSTAIGEQSNTIPIVFNQNGSNGFVAAPDDAVLIVSGLRASAIPAERFVARKACLLPPEMCAAAHRAAGKNGC